MPIHNSLIEALDGAVRKMLTELSGVQDVLSSLKRDLEVIEIGASAGRPPLVAAVDSSRRLASYSMAFIYAIQAVAVTAGSGSSEDRPFVDTDAGYLVVSPRTSEGFSDEIVSRSIGFLSRRLEVSTMLLASEKAEIALFDGSLFYFLWYGKYPEIPRVLKSFRGRPARLRDVWRGIAEDLNRLVRSGVVPVFISKSIRRSYYVEKLLGLDSSSSAPSKFEINDILLINALRQAGALPSGTFLLEPIYVERVEDLPRPLNALEGEDRSLVEPLVPVTITYAVFNPIAQPYQITIPGRWGWDELSELASSLYPYSRSGYPDPLKLAHALCEIDEREFKNILLRLGVSIPTGRELLGELA